MKNKQAWLNTLPLFVSLKESDIVDLLRHSQIKELAKGDVLFLQGESAGNFYIVISGWIKLCRETGDGHEALTGLCSAGDTFGEAVLYRGAHYPFAAIAIESSQVLRTPATTIKDLIQHNHTFANNMIQAMTQRVQTLELQVEHLSLMTATQRIGCFLLRLSHGKHTQPIELMLPYDKGIVATFLGIKLETFSRSLHQLKPLGVEVNGPIVTIADSRKLQEYVCITCSTKPDKCDNESSKE